MHCYRTSTAICPIRIPTPLANHGHRAIPPDVQLLPATYLPQTTNTLQSAPASMPSAKSLEFPVFVPSVPKAMPIEMRSSNVTPGQTRGICAGCVRLFHCQATPDLIWQDQERFGLGMCVVSVPCVSICGSERTRLRVRLRRTQMSGEQYWRATAVPRVCLRACCLFAGWCLQMETVYSGKVGTGRTSAPLFGSPVLALALVVVVVVVVLPPVPWATHQGPRGV